MTERPVTRADSPMRDLLRNGTPPIKSKALLSPARIIAGVLHILHDVGPFLSDFGGGVPRRKWQVFDRTAHEDHGGAPTVRFAEIAGKWRIRLIKQLNDHRQRADSIRPQPNERPTDGVEYPVPLGPGLNADIRLKNTHQLRYACF